MKRFLLLLPMFLGALPTAAQQKETVVLVADPWCPYNCEPGGDLLGVGIDLARRAFASKGLRVEYRTMDYELAVKETRAGTHSAIVGCFRSDAPDFVFPVEPMGMSQITIFVKKGDPWRFTGAPSLAGRKVGVIEGYTYDEPFDSYLERSKGTVRASGEDALSVLIAKLLQGEIDTILEDRNVFLLRSRALYVAERIEEAGTAEKRIPLYVAFSPKRSDSARLARIFSEGVADLRRTKELAAILHRYGMKDWK